MVRDTQKEKQGVSNIKDICHSPEGHREGDIVFLLSKLDTPEKHYLED